ncbi:hypothetical protein [Hydrogenophilus hirschii]|nr:hypothetical protein [Rhodocyclaceae bacterium]HNQ49458.1 hypothetical protein [Hydrogenophilus thermoluteolus]
MFRADPPRHPASRRLLLAPWQIALIALPYRGLPKPDWGFYPGLRALLRYGWLSFRLSLPPRARVRYWLLHLFAFRFTQRRRAR